jgi:hypothetical protein
MKPICTALIATLFFACSTADPETADRPQPSEAQAPTEAAESATTDAPDDAVATFLQGGDYRFALEDSAVLTVIEGKCSRTPEPEACLATAKREASGEGVAITPLGGDRVRYLSYVHEGGEQKTHLEAITRVVATEEEGIVQLVDGEVIVGPQLPDGAKVLIEVVDDDTIAMDKALGHPRDGELRLVFHRSPR